MPLYYVVTILIGARRIHKLYRDKQEATRYALRYRKQHKKAQVEVNTYKVDELPAQIRKTITSTETIEEVLPKRTTVRRIK